MLPKEKATREQTHAVSIFTGYQHRLQSILTYQPTFNKDSPMFETDHVEASLVPYRVCDFPRPGLWCWNQSSSKFSVLLPNSTFLTIRKICPRVRKSAIAAPPSFKVWIYHVKSATFEYYFLWCQQGTDVILSHDGDNISHMGINTPIGIIYPQRLKLDNFSFLAQFMDSQTVKELGWFL